MDSFLEKRKTEYSRYLHASMYPPKMVKKILDETTGLKTNENGDLVRGEARINRENLINRPRKDKKKPGKRRCSRSLPGGTRGCQTYDRR